MGYRYAGTYVLAIVSSGMHVIEAFEITGRGVGVTLSEETDLPTHQMLTAFITRPDGKSLSADASKEWARRGGSDQEAFIIVGVCLSQVLIGSLMRLVIRKV